MAKNCPNCGKQNNNTAKFCESCGTTLRDTKPTYTEPRSSSEGVMGWWDEQSPNRKLAFGLLGACCIGVILLVAIGGLMSPDQNTSTNNVQQATSNPTKSTPTANSPAFKISNVAVSNEGYGSYSITGDLTPSKNFSYLEMVTVWYDASGSVIYRNPIAWNMNDLKSGQNYKFKTSDFLYQKGTPTKVELLVFDSAFGGGDDSRAIYKQTIAV